MAERDDLARGGLRPAGGRGIPRRAALHVPLPQPRARGRHDDAQLRGALSRASVQNVDAPRRVADRDVLDAGVLRRVDDRYAVRSAVRDVELPAVAGERHVPRTLADLDGRDHLVRRGVDHHHGPVAAVAEIEPLAVRVHRQTVGARPGLDRAEDLVLARIHDIDGIRALASDIGFGSVGGERDAARSCSDLELCDQLARRDVDDLELVVLFRADVHEFSVRREDGVLGVIALDLHLECRGFARGVDEDDAVRELDRRCEQLAIGRDVDAFGRLPEIDALRHRPLADVDHHQRVARLVRDVRDLPGRVDRSAARLAARLDLADDFVALGVDERDRPAVFVAHEREPGACRAGRESGQKYRDGSSVALDRGHRVESVGGVHV